MKNKAKADRPKSAKRDIAAPPLPGAGKAAQTAYLPERRDGKSFIQTVNHFFNALGILKIRYF